MKISFADLFESNYLDNLNFFEFKRRHLFGLIFISLLFFCPQKSFAGGKDTIPPVLVVNGPDTTYFQFRWSTLVIPKVISAYDSVDGNLISSVVIDSSLVDTSKVGVYRVAYQVSDLSNNASIVYRYISVIDTFPPYLEIFVANPYMMEVNTSFHYPVVKAGDKIGYFTDAQMLKRVKITSDLDTSKPGVYYVTFNLTDSFGNKANPYTITVYVEDRIPPVITLKGPQYDSIPVFSSYTDPGYSISDNYTPTANIKFTITGTFYDNFPGGKNANKLGGGQYAGQTGVAPVYTIVYTAMDGAGNDTTLTRFITVYDSTAPVIKLVGPRVVQICADSSWVDSGYTLSDNYEDSASMKVNVFGNLFANWSSNPGLYWLRYRAMDQSHNIGYSQYRYVEVLPSNDSSCQSGGKSSPRIIDTTICRGSCPVFTAPVSGSAYLWSTGETTKSIQLCFHSDTDTAVCVTITKGSYSVSYIYNISLTSTTCVWPGDANYDGIADKNDVLAIGVAYNDSGPGRKNASTNWAGQPCNDWSLSFKSGANYKNADCNGDGIIDSTDMLAVSKNYGYKHYKSGSQNGSPSDPPLAVTFSKDSARSGDTVVVTINLGSASNPVINAYGIAFSLNYNYQYVRPGKTSIDLSHTWLGISDKNLIYFIHDDSANGTIDVAITRTDHKNISGYGELARVSIIMQDNLGGKTIVNRKVLLTPSDVKLISFDESEIPLYATGDSIVVTGPLSSISNNASKALKDIRMYPNPASQIINIDPGNQDITNIRIINALGMVVFTQNEPDKGILQILVSSLNPGIYTVIIDSKNGTVTRQVFKN